MIKQLSICFLFFFCITLPAQDNFRVMFYNVENLFDTKDNLKTNDDDFLPKGKQRWTNYRYWEKLKQLSQVIDSVGQGRPPALVGVCEVENDSVLFDLCRRAPLRRHKYNYIISHSKDGRGINVGLLYQRDEMKILSVKEYTPIFEGNAEKRTRNVLHVSAKLVNGDVLDVFVCHFPSRVEGIKRTKPFRVEVAKLIKKKVDDIFATRKNANIIVMGDFNDYPDDISLENILEAKSVKSNIVPTKLYNMFYHRIADPVGGTYKYRGKWRFMDQFIVSGALLETKGKTKVVGDAVVYSAGFLLEKDLKYGGEKPFRMYSGYKYLGGVSDHLPIYVDIEITE